jgi:dipeptidase E
MALLLMSKTTDATRIERAFFRVAGVPQTLAYIPSKTDSTRKYFSIVQNHYLALGIKEIRYCDLDQEFNSITLDSIRSSDAIYLAGGFTPYFLEVLRSRQAISLIRELNRTCPIIGVSAGALILGRNLSILFDDSIEGTAAKALSSADGIGLYDFEFWPHFGRLEADEVRLKNRSSAYQNQRIIGCDDLSGLIVGENEIRVVGRAHVFFRGNHQLCQDESLCL